MRDAGGRAHAVQIDLATPGAVDRLMAVAAEHLDAQDILVNNAALDFGIGRPIADTDEQLWDDTMIVNAKSAFLTTRHAARNMRDGGRIINVSTANTIRHAPGNAAYAASKGAIEQLTRVAAIELGARGITVNAVCPGATDTDLLRHTNPGWRRTSAPTASRIARRCGSLRPAAPARVRGPAARRLLPGNGRKGRASDSFSDCIRPSSADRRIRNRSHSRCVIILSLVAEA